MEVESLDYHYRCFSYNLVISHVWYNSLLELEINVKVSSQSRQTTEWFLEAPGNIGIKSKHLPL